MRMATRRSDGDGALFWSEKRQRWIGRMSAGYRADGKRIRIEVSGRSKREARDRLRERQWEFERGTRDRNVTVAAAALDWLEHGLVGRSPATVDNRTTLVVLHIVPELGKRKLADLTAQDVDRWLTRKSASLSKASLERLLSVLRQILRRAMARELVHRNVAELCLVPDGRGGRPSKSLTIEEAQAVLAASREFRVMDAYVTLSVLTGARTEELRALTWADLDLDGDPASVSLVRSVRHGGDTKTATSRRRLALPALCVQVLRSHRAWQLQRQLRAEAWADNDLVFTTRVGTALDAANVRRDFRRVVKKAGLDHDQWTPREMRHSFVSLMSNSGVAIEEIAYLVGHANSRTTEKVYRKELRPVLRKGAEAMDTLFGPEVSG